MRKTLKSFCTNAPLRFSRTKRLLPGQPCMCRGVACGDDWCNLTDLLCSMIQFGSELTRTIRRPCAWRRSRSRLSRCAFTFAALMKGTGHDRYGRCTVSGDFEAVCQAINPLWRNTIASEKVWSHEGSQ